MKVVLTTTLVILLAIGLSGISNIGNNINNTFAQGDGMMGNNTGMVQWSGIDVYIVASKWYIPTYFYSHSRLLFLLFLSLFFGKSVTKIFIISFFILLSHFYIM